MQSSLASLSKTELRAYFRTRRRILSQDDQLYAAKNIVQRCTELNTVRSAKTVALYLANDGELNPQLLIENCWNWGKTVYLPVLHPFASGHLAFFEYTESTPMLSNRYGIPEPKLDVRTITKVSDLDLVFTPLVAFDNHGHRLGMGGGFYDRTLASIGKSNKTQLIGLAHDCQQAATLTSESWDIPLSTIITPTQLINVKS